MSSAGRVFLAAKTIKSAPGRTSAPTVSHGMPMKKMEIADTTPTPVPVAMNTPLISINAPTPPRDVELSKW